MRCLSPALVVARHGRPVRRNFASIKKEWTRRYSTRVGPFGSRKVELPEVQGAIKETDALQPVGFNRNVIARRPKADVAIQSRQLLRSSGLYVLSGCSLAALRLL
jgi:hypothetical protein